MEIAAEAAWAEGISLSEALQKYSEPDLWRQFELALARITPKLPPDDLPPPTSHTVIPASPLPFDPSQLYGQFEAIRQQLNAHLLELLKTGELIGIGFKSPNLPGNRPEYINRDHWLQNRVSLSESELWGASYECLFEDIRVISFAQT